MNSVIFLENINITTPYKKIYQRLGFKARTTEITARQQKETDELIKDALVLISLQGSTRRLAINKNDEGEVSLENDLTFVSNKLSVFLTDSPEAVLLGATAGCAIMAAIRESTNKNNLAAAVVYDATASEMVDSALDWIVGYLNNLVRREGKSLLSGRFSAGYADFALENQKAIYIALQMEKYGVSINSSFILQPEKSVTAVTGIKRL